MIIEIACHRNGVWWYFFHDKNVTTVRFLRRFLVSWRKK